MGFSGNCSALYADLAASRGGGWRACTAGCRGLAQTFSRAQGVLAGRDSPPSEAVVAQARSALEMGARGSNTVSRLCRAFEVSCAAKSRDDPGTCFVLSSYNEAVRLR